MRLEYDWQQVARLLLISRALDIKEETQLVPDGQVGCHFSACGHELAQIVLALTLDHPHDGASLYYRSRPFMLGVGMTPDALLAGSLGRAGSPSEGRDGGMGFYKSFDSNKSNNNSRPPTSGGVTVLPVSAYVGGQFTPAVGWAQSIRYRTQVLGEEAWRGAIAVALGGDGSVATNGFWASLTIATTMRLPMLFLIEDNGYAISVRSDLQTPGGNIAHNLASFKGLTVLDADGCDPAEVAASVGLAVSLLREGDEPVLLRVKVPRLGGHSSLDNQAYRSIKERIAERKRDPLHNLRDWLLPKRMTAKRWHTLAAEAQETVQQAYKKVRAMAQPAASTATTHLFFTWQPQPQGGLLPEKGFAIASSKHRSIASPKLHSIKRSQSITLMNAIRHTMQNEMERNPRLLLFGQDVGAKGGLYGASRGLQAQFGRERVFDTSLNAEGIVGRAIGMALAGLLPLAEIQSGTYLDSAIEQIRNIGSIRWRTANQFAVPMVLRMPIGVCLNHGSHQPWHFASDESILAHIPGWRIAIPSNAHDAVGLLRTALHGNDPTFFLEHRALLNQQHASRPYPPDQYTLPFGQAAYLTKGSELTVVTWGAMVYRCLEASHAFPGAVELLDLRTIVPWDKETVLNSVKKSARCLIVHEENGLAGFGAEITATIAHEAFMYLDAPIQRLTGANSPMPYNRGLVRQVVPSVARIRAAMEEVLSF